ncbi:hypothetical protein BLA29_014164, partial [Euroglyphus maynei]
MDVQLNQKKSKEFRNNRKNLYTRKGDKQTDKSLKHRSISMQELGLATNSNLNIRYFSRDKLHKTASLTDNEDSDSCQNQPVLHSLMNFATQDISSPISEKDKSHRKNLQRKLQTKDG